MTPQQLPDDDRSQAGRVLAERLQADRGRAGAIVLALPRGGVAVGYEIAHALHLLGAARREHATEHA